MRYETLDLRRIERKGREIRSKISKSSLRELQASIEAYGLLQPVVVFETGKGRYELVAGHRRFAVCLELGWDSIPAMVTKSEKQAGILAQAQENLVREDMTLQDELELISQAMQIAKNEQQAVSAVVVALMIGKSQSWVKDRLQLLDLPDAVRSRVRKHEAGTGRRAGIALSHATEIARLKDDPETQEALADKIEREGLRRPQIAAAVRAIKKDPSKKAAILNARTTDSSFDELTRRKQTHHPVRADDDVRKKPAAKAVAAALSQAYMNFLVAFDDDRAKAAEESDEFGEMCAEIAEKTCYLRALLEGVIGRWELDRKCGWEGVKKVEVDALNEARVLSLKVIGAGPV